MYTPDHFRADHPERLLATLAAARPAVIVTNDGQGGFEANHVPLLVDAPDLLLGHVAKSNPLAGMSGRTALAIFAGPDAYVTPSWYPSKAETGRVVPTWNYVAVHVHGRIDIFDDIDQKRDLLARLTDHHEALRPLPWALADAPEDYLAAQMRGVVGLRLVIERIEAKTKLSQNRTEADRAGVAAGLRRDGGAREAGVADVMDAD